MKTAIITDIHANLEALQAVLDHAREQGTDQVVCLGDVVGYNADPDACVELLRAQPGLRCLRGNHDAMAADDEPVHGINAMAHAAITWTRNRLTPEQKAWLKSLPLVLEDPGVTYTHASLNEPSAWHYVKTSDSAERHFARQETTLGFVGHSHLPFAWREIDGRLDLQQEASLHMEPGERWLVSVGSVGQPRDHDRRAAYVLHDTDAATIRHIRVPYDVSTAQRKIREAGLPERLAERLE